MKTSLTLLFSFLFLSAQAQYTVDWSNAPLNPFPDQYTRNHFQVVGNVVSRRNINDNTTIIFNEAGKVVSEKKEYGNTDYTYDSSGYIVQRKMGSDANWWVEYVTNKKGFVSSIINKYKDGKTVTLTLEYDKKNLFVSKMKENVLIEKYEYDGQGRIIKKEFFYNGKPGNTYTYHYTETAEGLTVVETKFIAITGMRELDMQKFNKRGDVVYRYEKKSEYQYDSHGNILSGTLDGYPIKYEYVYAND